MKRVLEVGAVLDTLTPAAWIVDLLERLEQHRQIKLHVVCNTETTLSAAGADPSCKPQHDTATDLTVQPRHSPLGRLAQWILTQQTNRPLFTQNPWAASTFTPHESDGKASASSVTNLPCCDVILNLTSTSLPELSESNTDTPIWCAHTETLKARVKEALLDKAPLVWVYLWSSRASSTDAQVLACHALPRQTFSLSDLQRAACFCLPALIESRLNWMANGVDVAQAEYASQARESDTSISAEHKAAYTHALELSATGFALKPRSDLALLMSVCTLLMHQNLARVRGRLFREQWELAISSYENGKSNRIEQLCSTPVSHYTSIGLPDNTLWADPHLYEHKGERYIFFEEMTVDAQHAHLSVARLGDSGQITDVRKVLDEGNHLSYPFVFSHDDEHYMIPETAARNSISLYRATSFPDQWEHLSDLLSDVEMADTTLHHDNGTWWMFTNTMSHRCVDERDELNIFHAQSLTGPWQPHPLNPVITGVDKSRMAGPLISEGGQLYRVSQYGAYRYGYGINIHRIDQLDKNNYRETGTCRILPDASGPWIGCHSISQLPGVTVLDRLKRVRR